VSAGGKRLTRKKGLFWGRGKGEGRTEEVGTQKGTRWFANG